MQKSIIDLIEAQARKAPEAPAVAFGNLVLSYQELWRQADAVARSLKARALGAEERVGVYIERSPSLVAAMLGVWRAGAVYVPLDPIHPRKRTRFLIADAEIKWVLTNRALRREMPESAVTICLDEPEEMAPGNACECRPPGPQAAAYILYTSGSTGAPKGIVVEHGGLPNLAQVLAEMFSLGAGDRVLQFASPGFDASLFEILMALGSGAALQMGTPDELVPGPALARLLRVNGVTHAALLPSVLAQLSPEAEEGLPALRVVISGGEACPPELAARWGAGRRFFNVYGPTEATVWTTVYEFSGDGQPLPIGAPIRGVTVHLLDESLRPISDGGPGELWIGGAGVARGYLKRPELTAERFVPDPIGPPGARLYRSGDLARRRPDGLLEFLGRTDDQLKIRGVRVEPSEIEAALTAHPWVREAAVASRQTSAGDQRLVAWVVLRSEELAVAGGDGGVVRTGLVPALRAFLQERLPAALVPSVLVVADMLARTSSGKVDRRALPAPDETRPELSVPYVEPRTPEEHALAASFAEVLSVSRVGVYDDFYELGGDSLRAAQVVARVTQELFHGGLSLSDLLQARTVAALAERVAGARALPDDGAEQGDAQGAPPLSNAQERAVFLQQLSPTDPALHLPAVIRVHGRLDALALESALGEVVARHDALRTAVELVNGRPMAVPAMAVLPRLRWVDMTSLPGAEREEALARLTDEDAARPFELSRPPLLRVTVVRLGEAEHALVLVLHHVAGDALSLGVIVRELAALHAGFAARRPPVLPVPWSFRGHVARQRRRLSNGQLSRDLAYWREALAGAPAANSLRTDHPHDTAAGGRGALARFELSPELTRTVEELARSSGVTPFMVLLGTWVLTLHLEGAGEEMVVATPVAGRDRSELIHAVGCFADLVPIRLGLAGVESLRSLLRQTRERVIGAVAHHEVPLGLLIEALRPPREPGRLPLTQVMFSLQPTLPPVTGADGVRWHIEEKDVPAASFELLWRLRFDEGGVLRGFITYRADLFEAATIERLATRYVQLLAATALAPDRPLAELLGGVTESRAGTQAGGADAALLAAESALLGDPQVEDVAVRVRRTSTGALERVAYVAWSGTQSPARMKARLAHRCLASLRPQVWVPIHALPLTSEGRIDEEALAALPVLDDEVARRAEAELRGRPGVTDAAVAVHGSDERLPLLHTSVLLPPPAQAPLPHALRETPRSTDAALGPPLPEGPGAISDGGPLVLRGDEPLTLVDALRRAAAGTSGISWADAREARFQSYAQLLDEARAFLGGLRGAGLAAGSRAIVLIESSRDQLVAFWGCVLGGITPVLASAAQLHAQGALARLEAVHEHLGRPRVIVSAAVASALADEGALELHLLQAEELRGHAPAADLHSARPEDTAYLQLTSGTTGVPKCIRETHRAIALHHYATARFNGYGPQDVTLNWLPFDHVGALLGWHLKDVFFGSLQVQVETTHILADPLLWLDLINRHRVTHSWSPNFGFKLVVDRLVESGARGQWDLSSVRKLLSGGEQVTLPVVRAFLRLLAPFGLHPHAVQPSFGMAEACTGVTYHERFDPETGCHRLRRTCLRGGTVEPAPGEDPTATIFIDLGRPIPGVRLRIVKPDGELLPERVVGRLQIAGDFITPGYLDGEANRAAFTADGWFDTGDLGFLADGRLTLTGREKELIVIRGANLACAEVEELASRVTGVMSSSVAACAVEDPAAGTEALAIFFVPAEPGIEAHARIAAAITARVTSAFGIVPEWVMPISEEDLPRTSSGKLRRGELRRAFAEGRFARALAELEVSQGGARTVPDWFFRRVWRRREPGPLGLPRAGMTLVLLDRAGLGEALCVSMQHAGRPYAVVEPGDGFARLGERQFRIAPDDVEDWRRLFRTMTSEAGSIARVVHLWNWQPPAASEKGGRLDRSAQDGAFGLLSLAVALGEARTVAPVRLLVVSSNTQPVKKDDSVTAAHGLVLGLLAALRSENSALDVRHLDLPYGDPVDAAAIVRAELDSVRRDHEVAWRDGVRWVQRIERIDVCAGGTQPLPFREGGAWLMTGGLGPVGVVLGRYLLEHWRARLLVVGRTPLHATDEEMRPASSARQRALRLLSEAAVRSGGDVVYEAVDVCDVERLREAVSAAEARWGQRLDGAIHAAGVFRRRLADEENAASFAEALQPKIAGTLAVAQLLDERPGGLFLGFSSVAGTFGGWGVTAHAAGSRFLEHFTYARRRAGAPAECFAWGPWEVRSAGPAPAVAGASGLLPIAPEQGLASLVAGLRAGGGMLLMGLDPRSSHVLLHAGDASTRPQRITAWVTGTNSLMRLPLRDRFGVMAEAEVRRVERIARSLDGATDLAALLGRAVHTGPPAVPLRTEAERLVAGVWREVLRVEFVGADDNFFALGGHSLLLAELRARLARLFGRELPVVDLFRYPTVASMATRLSASEEAPAIHHATARAARQIAALKRHAAPPPRRRRTDE